MPLLQAPAAARRGRMLGDEDRMVPHRRLLAVVYRTGWGESFGDELTGVIEDGFEPLGFEVGALLGAESEARAEPRARKGQKEGIEIAHAPITLPGAVPTPRSAA